MNTFLYFSDKVIPLVFKNNLRTTLGTKLGKFKNIEAQQKGTCSFKKCVTTLRMKQPQKSSTDIIVMMS